MSERLRVAVIGAGRMGGFHARACAENPEIELVAVVDADAGRAAKVAAERQTQACGSCDERQVGRLDAAVVAVPTLAHLAVARPLLERGVSCLVEKPLAGTSAEAAKLVQAAQRGRATLQVGHSERFNPAFMALAQFNLKPRFIEAQRVSPCRFRSMDVGVVMDMMIHDIDLVLSLVRSPVTAVDAVGASLVAATEDLANVRLKFANGCVATLVASRAALKMERHLRIFSENGYVTVDFNTRQGSFIRPKPQLQALQAKARQSGPADAGLWDGLKYEEMLEVQPLTINAHDALSQQLAAFVRSVKGQGPVVVSGEDGLRAVEVAERITAIIAGPA